MMTRVEEELLLRNLYANPSDAQALLLEDTDFSVTEFGQIYKAIRLISPSVVNVPMLENWLTDNNFTSAIKLVASIAQNSPIKGSIEKCLEYQKAIRNQSLVNKLVNGFDNQVRPMTLKPETTFDEVAAETIHLVTDVSLRRLSAEDALFDEIRKRADAQGAVDFWPTGMKHIDIVTGGMARGQVWILNAPYKGSKTRSAINIAISALEAPDPANPTKIKPRSVLYITYDGLDTDLYRSFSAIYSDLPIWCFNGPVDKAIYEKWEKDESLASSVGDEVRKVPRALSWSSGHTKATPKYDYKTLDLPEVVDRIGIADGWKNVPLRIYDGRHPIRNLDSLQAIVMADRLRYNTDLVIVDYIQAMAASREYEELAKVADALQRLAVEQNVCVLEISQMSNETIRKGSSVNELATKGSGDFPATCDVGLEVSYSADSTDPTRIKYVLKVARRAPRLVDIGYINPMSGKWTGDWNLQSFKDYLASMKGANGETEEDKKKKKS